MKKAWIPFVASVMGAMVFASCSKEETKTYSNMMIVNASPALQTTTITTDESIPYTSTLIYGQNTSYIQVESGSARAIRTAIRDSASLITTLPAPAGQHQSVFLIDTGTRITALVVGDNLGTSGNRARLRFLNLSPNAVPVDVTVAKTVDTVFREKAYKQVADFNDFVPGVYNMIISRTGTTDTVCSVPTFSLSAGKVYTIYLKGYDSTYSGKTAISTSMIQHN